MMITTALLVCAIEFKAQRTITESFLFREIETVIYKGGVVHGKGETKAQCKANALRKLKGWTVTFSREVNGE